jgi:hypothetical protein
MSDQLKGTPKGGEDEPTGSWRNTPGSTIRARSKILTAEHWSLLSTRTMGSNEVFSRASIFVEALSGTIISLAFLAQATSFGPATAAFALVLLPVVLFVGLTTFARAVEINQEDAHWLNGMNLLRQAYLQIVPELEPFFVTGHQRLPDRGPLAHGRRQRLINLTTSLTTTSGVIAALNSVLAGSITSVVCGQLGANAALSIVIGSAISLTSAGSHMAYAGRYRETHAPTRSS